LLLNSSKPSLGVPNWPVIYFINYTPISSLALFITAPSVPDWKWDQIGMDFITGLPRIKSGYDSIWVVVGRLTKVAHFIPVKTTYTSANLADIYMKRIVCLHVVPNSIVSDRGTQFTSHFWKQLHESLGTRLEFSTTFHPQIDGQTERVNQILEDMLRACALDYGSS
jgi:hypothetical protein